MSKEQIAQIQEMFQDVDELVIRELLTELRTPDQVIDRLLSGDYQGFTTKKKKENKEEHTESQETPYQGYNQNQRYQPYKQNYYKKGYRNQPQSYNQKENSYQKRRQNFLEKNTVEDFRTPQPQSSGQADNKQQPQQQPTIQPGQYYQSQPVNTQIPDQPPVQSFQAQNVFQAPVPNPTPVVPPQMMPQPQTTPQIPPNMFQPPPQIQPSTTFQPQQVDATKEAAIQDQQQFNIPPQQQVVINGPKLKMPEYIAAINPNLEIFGNFAFPQMFQMGSFNPMFQNMFAPENSNF